MSDSYWNAALQAQRILEAWEQRDLAEFQAELRFAQQPFHTVHPSGADEEERRELLEGIASQLEQDLLHSGSGSRVAGRSDTCLRLLTHLAERPRQATRSGKLSCFPYSQSVRKTSACH